MPKVEPVPTHHRPTPYSHSARRVFTAFLDSINTRRLQCRGNETDSVPVRNIFTTLVRDNSRRPRHITDKNTTPENATRMAARRIAERQAKAEKEFQRWVAQNAQRPSCDMPVEDIEMWKIPEEGNRERNEQRSKTTVKKANTESAKRARLDREASVQNRDSQIALLEL
ncbi:hypothetical protein FRC08_005578 [Ceratobasidium sp. 394]|nr:hypothetical protein FRC08_005578 [Ceratobasidium sp. 394]KAG9086995.1 hypothetical protein FS749_003240 [Ceratobasidium sp. UAMH 11750]